jgi:hypothetical protein
MTKKDVRTGILKYVEDDLDISFGEDILLSEKFTESGLESLEVEGSFRDACESVFSVTLSEDIFELSETFADLLDECVEAVIEDG